MLELSLGTWDHDRVMALHDGRVQVPGVTLKCEVHPTSRLFPWAVQEARFDLTEMSISSYVLQLSRGGSEYKAIPAFVSRAFRHSGFFARAGSGIESLHRVDQHDLPVEPGDVLAEKRLHHMRLVRLVAPLHHAPQRAAREIFLAAGI